MSSNVLVKREKEALTELDRAMELAQFEIHTGKEHLEALLNVQKAMLPIEADAQKVLEEKILEARRDVHQEMLGYPRLSFEPLAWRHKSGLPKIVPMGLDNPRFTIEAVKRDWSSPPSSYISPELPFKVALCFADVCNKAEMFCVRSHSRMSYSFEFKGMIPDSARLKIADALQSRKFKSLYLLVETPDTAWKIERTKGLSRRSRVREALAKIELDPIVVGYAHDTFWVIDKFDLTDMEQYVMDEFSQLALPPGE